MAISKKLREKVWMKFNKHCSYCGNYIELKKMQVDHELPLCYTSPTFLELKGIKNHNDFENLMPACRRCNHYKRGSDLEGFRKIMITLHERIMNNYINKVAADFGIIIITPFDGKFYFERHDNINI